DVHAGVEPEVENRAIGFFRRELVAINNGAVGTEIDHAHHNAARNLKTEEVPANLHRGGIEAEDREVTAAVCQFTNVEAQVLDHTGEVERGQARERTDAGRQDQDE